MATALFNQSLIGEVYEKRTLMFELLKEELLFPLTILKYRFFPNILMTKGPGDLGPFTPI